MDNLEQEFPDLSEFTKYLSMINDETDRGCALIAAGYIDELLRKTLKAFMIDMNFVENLIGEMRPLGTFSARNLACRALGLISDEEFKDIDLIRRIRNEFSHEIDASFDDSVMCSYCNSLNYRRRNEDNDDDGKIIMSSVVQFRTCANSLILRLIVRPEQVSRNRCAAGSWSYLDLEEPLEAIGTKIVDLPPRSQNAPTEPRS